MCEPIYEIPLNLSVKQIREHERSQEKTPKIITERKKQEIKSSYELKTDYRVLPVFDSKDRLREDLTMRQNEYLRCKFSEYIHKPVPPTLKLQLYYEKAKQKPKPRRFSLNGQFYGNDNKLIPVPVMDDPRKYTKKSAEKKRETTESIC